MATNHIPRLLRLARRTGDRLIVTDEQGGGEPMVILSLGEYEDLVDQAFGPSLIADKEDVDQEISQLPQSRPHAGRIPVHSEESEAVVGADVTVDLALLEGVEVDDAFDDEAEIDEAALIDLWKEPTAAREEAQKAEKVEKAESEEKQREVEQKKPVRASGGEEQFYLEPID